MKKLLALSIVAVMLVLTLTACDTAAPTSGAATASPAAAEDVSWDYIKENGEIVVGLDPTFAPMGYTNEAGEIVGFDIDLAKAVCEKLGVTPKFQPIDWDSKEMELDGKKIDVIWNGMSKTPEREEGMTLSEPYFNNSIVIMTMKDSTIKKKADLVGKNVATQAESAGLEVLEADALYADIKDKLTTYKSYDEAIMDLEIGRVDAIVIDKVVGKYKSAQKPDTYAYADEDFGEDLYVIGMRKTDKAFAEKLQAAFDEIIADGQATKISETWFGEDLVLKK